MNGSEGAGPGDRASAVLKLYERGLSTADVSSNRDVVDKVMPKALLVGKTLNIGEGSYGCGFRCNQAAYVITVTDSTSYAV